MLGKSLSAMAVGAVALMGASTAHAGTTFVFENPGADLPGGNFTTGGFCNGISISSSDLCTVDDAAGLTYEVNGISLNAVGLTAGDPSSLIQDLAPNNSGLGVLSAGETNADDQVQFGVMESILISFESAVTAIGIDFNAGGDVDCSEFGAEGPCGSFSLFVDGALELDNIAAVDDLVLANIVGQTFEIVSTGPIGSGFTIGSFTIAEVPLPAGAWLLITGLAGLRFAGRRKAA